MPYFTNHKTSFEMQISVDMGNYGSEKVQKINNDEEEILRQNFQKKVQKKITDEEIFGTPKVQEKTFSKNKLYSIH